MPTATVKFNELYDDKNEELMIISAKQNGRFRIEVDRQLTAGVGRTRKSIAQNHFKEAIAGIQKILRSGIKASQTSGSLAINGISVGNVTYNYSWKELSPKTLARKKKRQAPGAGKFWLDYGGNNDPRGRQGLREIAQTMRPPKISMNVNLEGIDDRRANKKDPDRIDFTVNLTFGEMDFPFDQLVRRPLITGDSEADGDPEAYGDGEKEDVFIYLETGFTSRGKGDKASYVPARPWIRSISAEVGEQMFYNLIN